MGCYANSKAENTRNESGAIAGLFSVERREVAARRAARLLSCHTAGVGASSCSLPASDRGQGLALERNSGAQRASLSICRGFAVPFRGDTESLGDAPLPGCAMDV